MNLVKNALGANMGNTLKAMSHTEGCDECTKRFEAILEHGNISKTDSRFGILKMIKHQTKCQQCAKLFAEIATHAGIVIDKTKPILPDVVEKVVEETK